DPPRRDGLFGADAGAVGRSPGLVGPRPRTAAADGTGRPAAGGVRLRRRGRGAALAGTVRRPAAPFRTSRVEGGPASRAGPGRVPLGSRDLLGRPCVAGD